MTAIKNAVESFSNKLVQVEGRIHELEGVTWNYSVREKKKIEWKGIQKAYWSHETSSGELIFIFCEFWKEKKGRKGQQTYLKKEWLIISHIWGEICTSRYMTQRFPTRFNPKKTSLSQIIVKLSKSKTALKAARERSSVYKKILQGYKQTCPQKLASPESVIIYSKSWKRKTAD